MAPRRSESKDSAVEVEIPRWALLEPESIVVGRVLKELRSALQYVVVGFRIVLELVLLSLLLQMRRSWWRLSGVWLRFGDRRLIGWMRRRLAFRLEKRLILHQRIPAGTMSGLVRQLGVVLELFQLGVVLEPLPLLGLGGERRRIWMLGIKVLRLSLESRFKPCILARYFRPAPDRSKRLTFGPLYLGWVAATAAFEVEVFADRVIK